MLEVYLLSVGTREGEEGPRGWEGEEEEEDEEEGGGSRVEGSQ